MKSEVLELIGDTNVELQFNERDEIATGTQSFSIEGVHSSKCCKCSIQTSAAVETKKANTTSPACSDESSACFFCFVFPFLCSVFCIFFYVRYFIWLWLSLALALALALALNLTLTLTLTLTQSRC